MKWQWKKLVVDGKAIYVFPVSRIPKQIRRLKHLIGIEFKEATKEERQPFLMQEKKLRRCAQ